MNAFARPLVFFTLSLISTLVIAYTISDLPLIATPRADRLMFGLWLTSIPGLLASLVAILRARFIHRRFAPPIFVLLLAFFSGVCLFANDARRTLDSGQLVELIGEERIEAVIKGQVVSAPIPYQSGWAFDIIATHIDDTALSDTKTSHLRVFYPLTAITDYNPMALLPLPGDHIEGYLRLERFSPADLPGDISMRAFMENRGIAARANAREALHVKTPTYITLQHRFQRRLAARRIHLEYQVGLRLPPEQAAVAMGMLTASRGLITPEFRHPFDLTGTSHLLAISGLHLAVLASILWLILGQVINRFPWLLLRFGKKRVCGPIVVLMLIAYVIMIGAPVSAQRALLMLTVAILAYTTLRSFCAVHAISLAAILLILTQPTILFELGFQLSFLATAGIILFMRARPTWMRPPEPGLQKESKRRRFVRSMINFIGISFAATLSTWPAIVIISGELPVAGLWLNLLVVPAFSIAIFPVMAVAAIFLPIIPSIAQPALELATICIIYMQQGLDIAAYWPGSTIRTGNLSFLSWLLGTLSIIWLILGGLSRRTIMLATIAASMAFTSSWIAEHAFTRPSTRVHFIPVGQGDSTFVEFPDGTTMLVDAGGTQMGQDPGLHRVLPYLKSLGIRRIDYVIVSHAHQDHFGGFQALVRPFRPRNFIYDTSEHSPALIKLAKNMQESGSELVPIDNFTNIPLHDTTLNIIRPGGDLRGSTNDMSLVVSFQFAGASVLLPGDIEESSETWLLENNLVQPHTIIKLPHHGSKTSSTQPFVDALQPRIAIVPVGKHNHFGHPHSKVIQRYAATGASTFRTDQNGLIVLDISQEGEITVRTMR